MQEDVTVPQISYGRQKGKHILSMHIMEVERSGDTCHWQEVQVPALGSAGVGSIPDRRNFSLPSELCGDFPNVKATHKDQAKDLEGRQMCED